MFGPVMSSTMPASGPDATSLGTNVPGGNDLVQDGVPAVGDFQNRFVAQLGPAVLPCVRQLRESRQHVERGQHLGGLQQPRGLGRHLITKGQKQLIFAFVDLFLGRQHFFLIFLKLRA